jgi:hypothetical protein
LLWAGQTKRGPALLIAFRLHRQRGAVLERLQADQSAFVEDTVRACGPTESPLAMIALCICCTMGPVSPGLRGSPAIRTLLKEGDVARLLCNQKAKASCLAN